MDSAAAEKERVEAHYRKQAEEGEDLYAASPVGAGPSSSAAAAAAEDHGHTLPAYSVPIPTGSDVDAAVTAASKRGPTRYPGLPHLDYRLYGLPLFELSSDQTTLKTTAPYLSAAASALSALVLSQATVPPKPMIHIRGNRGRKVDFAIKLNLMNLLVPDDQHPRMNYVRCVAAGEVAMCGGTKPSVVIGSVAEPGGSGGGGSQAEVDTWCRRFVEDQSSVKMFVLERKVANMDVAWLEGQIRSLVATTAYKGVVTVTFPVTHARVVVQSPDRVNKFFTSVSTLFTGKSTYEVVKAVWPFASHRNGEAGRVCAVQSEDTWWREWRDPIRYAICTKRTGWVTNEDKLEALMEGVGKGITAVDWGSDGRE